jgi:hypothetical protein
MIRSDKRGASPGRDFRFLVAGTLTSSVTMGTLQNGNADWTAWTVDLSELLDEVLANPVYRGSSRAPQKVMAKEKRSLLRGGPSVRSEQNKNGTPITDLKSC